MPEVEPVAHAPSELRTPDELRTRRAAVTAGRRREVRRRLRTGGVALLGGMTLAGGGAAAAAHDATGGANAEAPASRTAVAQTLSPGDSGPAVRTLQRRLRVRPADGEYGPKTRRGVRRFQKRKGLPADGVAGPATLTALGVTVRASQAPSRVPAALQRIADCESGGNPAAVSPDGHYRGKYQFTRDTFRAHGGEGDPAKAPEAEQDRVAIELFRAQGAKPWPNCG